VKPKLVILARNAVGALLLICAGVTAQAFLAPSAHATYGFSSDQIVAKAESYADGYYGGQCKVWAQNVINAVLADNDIAARVGGYGSPGGAYYGAYENAGATLINALDARPGDLVQVVNAAQKNSDYPSGRLHTAIIVGMTATPGTFQLRDSNWNLTGQVSTHTLDVVAWAHAGGSEAYFWRFAIPAASSVVHSFADGTFVSYGGDVYRIAGGAPIYVSTWSIFGGTQPTVALSFTDWSSLKSRPVNGTDISAAGNGTVYRIVGGAPLVVTSCTIGTTNFCADAIPVDPYSISHLDHLNAVPDNGSDLAVALASGGTGSVYRVVGGAPLVVTSCTIGTTNFCGDSVPIDPFAVAHLDHLNAVPANGSDLALALSSGGTGSVYRTVGGAPLVVSACSIGTTNFCAYAVPIDPFALTHLDHLNATPANGSDVALAVGGGGTGTVYRVAGGALFVVPACNIASTDFCADAVAIDPYATDHLDHLNSQPDPGTIVATTPSGSYWSFDGTCRSETAPRSGAITVADGGVDAYATCNAA